MNDNNSCQQILSKLEHIEKYTQELENKLDHYEKAVIERDTMQNMTCVGLTLLDSVKNKQTSMFNTLISGYNELCDKYASTREQLNQIYGENTQVQLDKEQLNNKFNDQEVHLKNLNSICSTLKENAEKLQKPLSDISETVYNLRIIQQQIELELKDKDRKITDLQNSIVEKMAQNTELEKKIQVEQIQYKSLLSSKSDIEIENEKLVRPLKTEFVTIRDDLYENYISIEFINTEINFNNKEKEHKVINDELKELKKIINDLQELYEKEKCNAHKEIAGLNTEILSMSTELDLFDRKMCETQTENSILKFKLEDQCETIKGLKMTEEHLRQNIKKNKQAIDLTTQKLAAERKHRVKEAKLHNRKSLLKTREKCELQQCIEDQERQIKRLMMEMDNLKPTTDRHNSNKTFTSVLNTYLEFL